MKSCRFLLGFVYLALCCTAFAQSTNASLTGFVDDPSKAVIARASITAINTQTGVKASTTTSSSGQYVLSGLVPGTYRIEVDKQGFRGIIEAGLVLHVQDVVQINFHMALGSMSETVTVNANGVNINTTDGSVSTVVDRQFVENMPLNGRSFQNLLTLVPGVATVGNAGNNGHTGTGYGGEIVVNGQRTEANYFSVDGVSANTGTAPHNSITGAGFSGSTPGETTLGTTQSMVSIDALQEFRATTSTYSAEYGRTPGGQFSFSTRSGTNAWNGSLFEYFRNDAMDANNWFNNHATPAVPRLPERQNDFGGTLGGPIIVPGLYNGKNKTFFFFSYEGLRLTVPQPFEQFYVPDITLRQTAPTALQPTLNSFPLPNGGEDGLNDGFAFFNQAYSSPSSLDNVGIRVDHSFGNKLKLFGRYANTPSSGWVYSDPAIKSNSAINLRTLTVGATSALTKTQLNEFRFNLTQNNVNYNAISTNYGGATAFDISTLPGPNGQTLTPLGTQFGANFLFGGFPTLALFENRNEQRQFNVTDSHTWSHGVHQIKFGVDWHRLSTEIYPITIAEVAYFYSEASVLANNPTVRASSPTFTPVEPVYRNFSAFVQDDWKATSRLSLSLGLRWDINPAPGNLNGPPPYTVDQITNLNTIQLAPEGTPLWRTDWSGFAPRVGLAYQLNPSPGHETVLRTGFGLFYDTGNATGSAGFNAGVGFTSTATYTGVSFPLTSAQITLPPPSIASPYNAPVNAFDPNLKLPYTMQWNVAIEQAFGARQTLTINYVGSEGKRLLSEYTYLPTNNPNFSLNQSLDITSNGANSNYNALQIKYQQSLSHGLQVLSSYTWSHSIDDGSTNFVLSELLRGSSDFDIRNNFQAAIVYDVPGSYSNIFASMLLKHWGLDTRISARSALPIDLIGSRATDPVTQLSSNFHPNLVPGEPIYLSGSQYPGRRIINYSAFTAAPAGVDGNTGRNSVRAFGAAQTDVALRRDFPIHDQLHLQFRAEAFNIFNQAIFGSIYNQLSNGPTRFGYAYTTLNSSLGGLNPLYQVGGPRSLQLALKLAF